MCVCYLPGSLLMSQVSCFFEMAVQERSRETGWRLMMPESAWALRERQRFRSIFTHKRLSQPLDTNTLEQDQNAFCNLYVLSQGYQIFLEISRVLSCSPNIVPGPYNSGGLEPNQWCYKANYEANTGLFFFYLKSKDKNLQWDLTILKEFRCTQKF